MSMLIERPVCPTCGRDDFENVYGMKLHHKMAHGVSLAGRTFTCQQCGSEFRAFDTHLGPRKFCSRACYGDSKRKSPEDLEDFYHSDGWQSVKELARARDSYTCQRCSVQEPGLHVHHKVPISEGGDKFNLENLVTVCQDCHVKIHKSLAEKAHDAQGE